MTNCEDNNNQATVLAPFNMEDTAKAATDRQTVAEFYANKSVFVTGGTGFLGTVLIEALLSTTPDIGRIYVLVRGKRGDNAEQRLQKLLSKQIFQNHSTLIKSKVVPVIGELTAENFAFADDVLREIRENVQVIFHSAATIKFNTALKAAIEINVLGTQRTLQLAKSLRHLAAYVYLSTAFCNSDYRGLIKEKVYPSRYKPEDMIEKAAQNVLPTNADDEKTREIIGKHPNTYTFTKQLAETLIHNEMKDLPVGIVRPSVVYGTYESPVQGWVGNANSGHLGFLAGYVKGVFRTISGRAASVLDLIPCDYVINASLVMGWYVGQRKALPEPEVIHCTSGERNPLTMENFCKTLNYCAREHPCDRIVWKPHVQLRRSYRYTLFFYLFHVLPSFILYFPEMLLKKPRNKSTYRLMTVFHKGTKAFEFFTVKNFRYSLDNSMYLLQMLRPEDRAQYSYDVAKCDWKELISRCFKGLRQYYFRESPETTKRHKIMWHIFEVIHFLGFVFMFAMIFMVALKIVNPIMALVVAWLSIAFILWL